MKVSSQEVRYGAAVLLAAALSGATQAQQPTVQAAQGQSYEQMEKDKAECYSIASQSTGYNPAQASAAPASSTTPQGGGRLRGAAAGAMAGAARAEVRGNQYQAYERAPDELKQEYRRNEAKSAAAAGAVVGGARQRQSRREQARAQENQAAQQSAATSSFNQAYNSCLMGRGYVVK